MKRLLIVGLGSIGLRHARLYQSFSHLQIEVCDARAAGLEEALQQTPGIRTWENYDEALASGPDYVLVATPHHLHAGMACAALERGIPVLCEKPMSHDLAEAERMAALSASLGVPLAVGYHLRFHPSVQTLREVCRDRQAGQLLFARYRVDSLITLENSRSRYQATLPGSLLMDYSHGLDLLLHLVGETPTRVLASGIKGQVAGYEANPILLSGILGYETPFQAELHMSYTAKPEVHTLELLGDEAQLVAALNGGEISRRDIATGQQTISHPPYERDQLYLSQWRAFEEFCQGRASLICSADEALETNRLMEMILQELFV